MIEQATFIYRDGRTAPVQRTGEQRRVVGEYQCEIASQHCRLCLLQKTAGVRTTRMHPLMLRERARTDLDRHLNYILAAYMSSGT